MRDEDLEILKIKFEEWNKKLSPKKILVLSPSQEEFEYLKKYCSQAQIKTFDREDWDLENPCPFEDKEWDVIVISNSLFYSRDVKLWFKNISSVAKYLWLQDVVEGSRGGQTSYLGGDGDSHRFKCIPLWESSYEHATDLGEQIGGTEPIEDFQIFSLNSPGIHFVSLINLLKIKISVFVFYIQEFFYVEQIGL